MPYPIELKNQAISLRKKGFSLKEIAEKLGLAKSTASKWLSPIVLSKEAKLRLQKRKLLGQYKSMLTKQRKRIEREKELNKIAYQTIKTIHFTKPLEKLCCALIWWCEGNKTTQFVRFTSSDVSLVRIFLKLFRSAFDVDEKKFRILMHLHRYHNEQRQKDFWSKITKIPPNQFNRSFQKPNTGKRTQKDYPGCVAVGYYDSKIAKELASIYNTYVNL